MKTFTFLGPTEQLRIFWKAYALRKQGFDSKQISKTILRENKIKLSFEVVSKWFN